MSVISYNILPGQCLNADYDCGKAAQPSIGQVPTRDTPCPVLNIKGQSLHFWFPASCWAKQAHTHSEFYLCHSMWRISTLPGEAVTCIITVTMVVLKGGVGAIEYQGPLKFCSRLPNGVVR